MDAIFHAGTYSSVRLSAMVVSQCVFFFIIFRVVQSEVRMKRHDCPPISVKKWAVHYHRQTTAQPGHPGQDGQPGAR